MTAAYTLERETCLDGDECITVRRGAHECGECVYRSKQPMVYAFLAQVPLAALAAAPPPAATEGEREAPDDAIAAQDAIAEKLYAATREYVSPRVLAWIRAALAQSATPVPREPCPSCSGTGKIGIPGAPCPFCKLHALAAPAPSGMTDTQRDAER